MTRELVFVGGSPSLTSRSAFVAQAIAAHPVLADFNTRVFSVRDFDPADVLLGRATAPALQAFLQAVSASAAVVLSTPVYKATYAGGLKALIDLIPPDALVSKPLLGIATTKLSAHGLDVDRAYRALFTFFRARGLGTVVVADDEVRFEGGKGTLLPEAQSRVERAAHELFAAAVSPTMVAAVPDLEA
jgi:FMN reductase